MTDRTKRPNIKPEWSLAEKILQIICVPILLAGVIMLIAAWGGLPKNVPVHFSFFGTPDRYAAKSQLIALPIIFVGLYIMLTVLERFPGYFNFPFEITESNARYVYQTAREMLVCIKTEAIAAFTYVLFAIIKTAKGELTELGQWFLITFLILLAATTAYYIIRLVRHKGGEEANSFQQ